jgi:hypothetical protein
MMHRPPRDRSPPRFGRKRPFDTLRWRSDAGDIFTLKTTAEQRPTTRQVDFYRFVAGLRSEGYQTSGVFADRAAEADTVHHLMAKTGGGTYSGAMQDIINRQDAQIENLKGQLEKSRDELNRAQDAWAALNLRFADAVGTKIRLETELQELRDRVASLTKALAETSHEAAAILRKELIDARSETMEERNHREKLEVTLREAAKQRDQAVEAARMAGISLDPVPVPQPHWNKCAHCQKPIPPSNEFWWKLPCEPGGLPYCGNVCRLAREKVVTGDGGPTTPPGSAPPAQVTAQ